MKKINIFYTLLTVLGVLFFYSCSEDKELEETRLFSPVLNNALSSRLNTITVDMANFKDAVSYKVEISRDTFKTVEKIKTYNFNVNKAVITDLLWNRSYQVRATAIAASPEFNSKVSDLGSVKTEAFPGDLLPSAQTDFTDTQIRVNWTVRADNPITVVKVFANDDDELLFPLASYETTSAEQLAGNKIISDLKPGTTYQLAIYNATSIRGWDYFTTLNALTVGPNDTDLRGITITASLLTDALNSTPEGGMIILDPTAPGPNGTGVYGLGTTYAITKSVTIKSGYSLDSPTGATLSNTGGGTQFDIAPNLTLDKIVFDGVYFKGDTGLGRYVLNITNGGTTLINELRYVNCRMDGYRDLVRARAWTSGGISLLTIDNCIFSNFSSQGFILVDQIVFNPLQNVVIKNSTFSRVAKLTNQKSVSNTVSFSISDCTFSETPASGQSLFVFSPSTATIGTTTYPATNINSNLVIKNCIFGGAATPLGYPFITSGHLPGTLITSSNTYNTKDVTFTAPVAPATTPAPSFTTYSGVTSALWVDPFNTDPLKLDFHFKDVTFAGSKTCGDPRWRRK